MPRRPVLVRTEPCPHCGNDLIRARVGNIIHWTHNPASPTGAACPPKES